MKLNTALRIYENSRVAFVGSGGKTSAIAQVAAELKSPCLITTTTHLGVWQKSIADIHIIIENADDWKKIWNTQEKTILVTGRQEGNRLTGIDIPILSKCLDYCNDKQIPLLIECDGSRQLPLKFPKKDEPLVPEFVDTVVVCCGLSGLGQPLNSNIVYQPEQFSAISGIAPGKEISVGGLEKVLSYPDGGLKHIPVNARSILLLNQADTIELQVIAGEIKRNMTNHYDGVVISSLIHNQVFSITEPTAAIILAAGSSSRYGQTKQLLRFNQGTFLQSIIDSVIMAGLSPVIVVTGSNHEQVEGSLRDQDQISLIYNHDWEEGQSTSIRAGLGELERSFNKRTGENEKGFLPGCVIFLLADQPQVQPALLEALANQHTRNLSPVIAPLVDGQRANPVLFDRVTFPSLKSLQGNTGGRGIFANFPPSYIPWYDNSMLIDVDTNSDYSRLLNETN